MKIAYARTSQDSQDLARQIKQLREAGVPDHLIFRDQGVSGAKDPEQRPGYKQLVALLDTGEVKEMYVTDISRLGRDAKGTLQEIWRLQDAGIRVVSLNEMDRFVLTAQPELQPLLTAAVTLGADLQRKKIRDDTKAGLARARAQGKQIGRKRIEVDWEKIESWKKRGLSERAAAIVCGYHLATFYKRKKERGVAET
jgi:DNA invertase Pin-like site-specific DNA recombinase